MQVISRSRLSAVLLAFLFTLAGAIVPFGSVASAASAATTCPSTEGGYQCVLVISAPDSVPVDQPFTVDVLVTTGGEGTSLAKSDPCGSKVQIRLDVFGGESFFASYLATASGAIATFSVTLSPAGQYHLNAHQESSESAAAAAASTGCSNYYYVPADAYVDAVLLNSAQPIAPCPPNVSCKQVTNNGNGGQSAATLYAADGVFNASFGPWAGVPGGQCSIPPADPNNGVLSFTLSDNTVSKTIIFALGANLITQGIGLYNICWSSTNPFTQLGGTPAPQVGSVFVGNLPKCKTKTDTGPCVLFRNSGQGNVGFFGVNAPAGDPQAYPEAPTGP